VANHLTAVIIDDDIDTVESTSLLLQLLSVEIIGIGYNGHEAISQFESLRPDVMFLDLMMPEYDGFYALKKIKELDPKVKVVVITADVRRETCDEIDALNPYRVILKPFDMSELKNVIDNLKNEKFSVIENVS
jgi:DNA-binding NarL/FixJ family response regulator